MIEMVGSSRWDDRRVCSVAVIWRGLLRASNGRLRDNSGHGSAMAEFVYSRRGVASVGVASETRRAVRGQCTGVSSVGGID